MRISKGSLDDATTEMLEKLEEVNDNLLDFIDVLEVLEVRFTSTSKEEKALLIQLTAEMNEKIPIIDAHVTGWKGLKSDIKQVIEPPVSTSGSTSPQPTLKE